ncbi:MAG TPA: DUF6314 family protein [Sphingomicrobium sp.]|nr:DUF6314 family protein [Sphingomicrobium sp.]
MAGRRTRTGVGKGRGDHLSCRKPPAANQVELPFFGDHIKGKSLRQVSDLRAFLAGTWHVDRSVLDRRQASTGELNGLARFTPFGRSLLYEERGTLTFGAHRGPAEQHLKFEFPDGETQARVRFRDGRPFHELDLSDGEANVSHPCGDDLYEGRFVVIDAGHWRSSWQVAGPRKDQEIVTHYIRLC